MNWGIFGISYARSMFVPCQHLSYGTVELPEIHKSFSKLNSNESITYYKVTPSNFYFIITRQQNEVVHGFVKPLIVISFQTRPVTVRFEDDFRFGTTTELSL